MNFTKIGGGKSNAGFAKCCLQITFLKVNDQTLFSHNSQSGACFHSDDLTHKGCDALSTLHTPHLSPWIQARCQICVSSKVHLPNTVTGCSTLNSAPLSVLTDLNLLLSIFQSCQHVTGESHSSFEHLPSKLCSVTCQSVTKVAEPHQAPLDEKQFTKNSCGVQCADVQRTDVLLVHGTCSLVTWLTRAHSWCADDLKGNPT